MDRIELRGLRALGVHGVLAEERERAQPFEVDVALAIDLAPAGTSDDLAKTIHYGELAEMVVRIVERQSFLLIESLAEHIAEACKADPRVVEVTVTVCKLRPPIPVEVARVAVTVTR
jgi:7,8-dihydroneopterin aldolase/epimerase/oxygenase